MKAHVNKDGCISCGICVTLCPEVFQFDNEGKAEPAVDTIPKDNLDGAENARFSCPVNVIDLYE